MTKLIGIIKDQEGAVPVVVSNDSPAFGLDHDAVSFKIPYKRTEIVVTFWRDELQGLLDQFEENEGEG